MATLAIHNPTAFEEDVKAQAPRLSGDFAGMEDAEVMLALRDGDMAAFDVLVQKYRKPIIHFMFRMVHNEAVAEFSVASDIGRLTALDLKLPVKAYDFDKHYRDVRGKWIGLTPEN